MIALKPAFIAEELTLEGTVNMNCTLPSVQSHICDKAGIKRLQPANVLREVIPCRRKLAYKKLLIGNLSFCSQ